MSRSPASRAVAGALLALLVLAGGAPTAAAARPDPVDAGSPAVGTGPFSCALQRIDTQLIRCDNLTGAGVPAPLFIPQLEPILLAGSR